MSDEHTVLLDDVRTTYAGDRARHCLYYYQGNFYAPLDIHGGDIGRVKKAIRQFKKANAEQIAQDRAHPDYKTLLELFDAQFPA